VATQPSHLGRRERGEDGACGLRQMLDGVATPAGERAAAGLLPLARGAYRCTPLFCHLYLPYLPLLFDMCWTWAPLRGGHLCGLLHVFMTCQHGHFPMKLWRSLSL